MIHEKPVRLFVDGVEINFLSDDLVCDDSLIRSAGRHPTYIASEINVGGIMEGRGWHSIAREKGAVLRPNMQRGKVYLYQLYTTCFVEFESMEAAIAFRKYADENIAYWDYDPVATLDTSDPEIVERWKVHMEET